MTNISIIDQSKIGAIRYATFIYGDKRMQLFGYPTYDDIYNALDKVKRTNPVIPLYKKKPSDRKNTVYYKDHILQVCNSDNLSSIANELNKDGAKFTSSIHLKYHQDPVQYGRPDQNCPYTKQNINYFEALQKDSDFFLIMTTISGIAYNPQSLYAQNVHLALNEGFQKDFLTNPKVDKKPEKLDEASWSDPIDGYWQLLSDKFDFNWFREIDDENIQKPSVLEELQLNLASLNTHRTISDEKVNIYSRDAYISHSYLPPAIRGFEYVNDPITDYRPKFYYLPDFKLSHRKLERLNFLELLLMFRDINEFVRYVADRNEGKIALLPNNSLHFFLQTIKKYRSEEMQSHLERFLKYIDDRQKLSFIKAVNQGRKRKFKEDTPIEEVILKVVEDYYINYLSKEPWKRVNFMYPDEAFYDPDLDFEAIILFGTHYQFSQAIKVVGNGMELHYHSLKSGGVTFKDKEKEREVSSYYIKFLKSLTNHLSILNVYMADPTFNHWKSLNSDVFEQLNLKSINLSPNSFIIKDLE